MKINSLFAILTIGVMLASFVNICPAQSWYSSWDNGGCGWLIPDRYGWHLDQYDNFVTGSYDMGYPSQLLAINISSGWAALQSFTSYSGGSWPWLWGNSGNGWIGPGGSNGWQIQSGDSYFSGAFTGGTSRLLAIRGSWAMVLIYYSGTGFSNEWDNGGDGKLGPWTLMANDRVVVANVLSSNSGDELLCIKSDTARILSYSATSGWSSQWSNGGQGTIGSWTIHSGDKYVRGDFDGDGTDDILFIYPSASGSIAMLQKFNGTNWVQLWSNGASGSIANWTIDPSSADRFMSGSLDLGSTNKLVAINPTNGWTMDLVYSGAGGWTQLWSNGGSGWIGGWHIQTGEYYAVDKFLGLQLSQLVMIRKQSADWAGIERFYPAPVISGVNASPSAIYWNQSSTVTCTATDPSGDALTYEWSNNGNGVGYQVSANGNTYTVTNVSVTPQTTLGISVTVRNAHQGSTVGTTNVTLYASSGGGGGCCPYVFTFDGGQFQADNNLLPQSEYPGNQGADVTDYYKLLKNPRPTNGSYVLEVREFEHERSFLDQFRLLAIDHNPATDIAVSNTGEIIEYLTPYQLNECIQGGDSIATAVLSEFDGNALRVNASKEMSLTFRTGLGAPPMAMSSLGVGVVLAGWAEPGSIKAQCIQKPQSVGGVSANGTLVGTRVSFTFRERPTLIYVPTENLGDNIQLTFGRRVALDYANIALRVAPTFKLQELALTSATHSQQGDIQARLGHADADYATLIPGESIQLRFAIPPMEANNKRDFVLMSQGKYEKANLVRSVPAVQEYKLAQNYPNPFNPTTTIRYEIPRSGHVTLTIQDLLGREVARLVDEVKEAGVWEARVDGSNLPTGVYVYKLVSGGFQETRKMVLMK